MLERIGIDILGPLTESKGGKKYIIVIQDMFTKWPEVTTVHEITASSIMNKMSGNNGYLDVYLLIELVNTRQPK